MWKSLAMESPLDILSRAAGMVSRNHEVNTSGSNSNSNSSNSHDNQCRILKLALVSSNGHNGILSSSSSSKEGQSPKQGYEHSLNITPPPETRGSPDVINGMDSDTPLDMSIKKPKRKIGESDPEDSGSGGTDEDKVKRKRPSVISYASHQANNVTGFDVDDHFKKSLGLESYNSVFSNAKSTSSTPAEGSPVPGSDDNSSTHEEEKLKSSSMIKSKVVQQSTDLETSVDDHFAKALGKSTWMKLQGL